jgi:hypothetical protein
VVVVPQYCLSGSPVGVEPGAVAGGVGVGTLLGPEGSGCPRLGVLSLRASLGAGTRECVWVALVGLLFEICIVDASILYRCRSWPAPVGVGGGRCWCVSL